MKKKLTERQSRFVKEYTDCGNGAEAAKKAGYSLNGARQTGSRNLRKPGIKKAIEKRPDEFQEGK